MKLGPIVFKAAVTAAVAFAVYKLLNKVSPSPSPMKGLGCGGDCGCTGCSDKSMSGMGCCGDSMNGMGSVIHTRRIARTRKPKQTGRSSYPFAR